MRCYLLFCFLFGWGLLAGMCSVAQTQPYAVSSSETLTVTVLHSNDVSGQLTRRSAGDGMVAGMAARVHLIRAIKRGGPTLLLDAGDAIGPDPLSASDRGATMITLMRMAGYDALLPANHEFNFGLDQVRRLRQVAGFPFLGANIQGPDSLVQPLFITTVGGPRVAVIGLVSQEVAMLTNPGLVATLTFKDPVTVATEVLKTLPDSVDYVILLAHTREADALRLAQQVKGVDLIITGGYYSTARRDEMPTAIHVGSRVRVVTTPGFGDLLGKVTVRFLRGPDGRYRPIDTEETLIPIDATAPEDSASAQVITQLAQTYKTMTSEILGTMFVDSPLEQTLLIANLIQVHTHAEIGVINRGALEEIDTDRPLLRSDIDRLVRFQARLTTMSLTGAQLKAVISQGSQTPRTSAQLVFAGLDPKTMTVLGRPLRDTEAYRVATTEFLANGGDGYQLFRQGRRVKQTDVELRQLVGASIREYNHLSMNTLRRQKPTGSWYAGWDIQGAFERNFVDPTTAKYRGQNEQVSFLSGATSVAWNSAAKLYLAYQRGLHETRLDQVMDFGQVGQNLGKLATSTDQINTELRYRYLASRGGLNPFVSVGSNTAFRRGTRQRPLLLRSSLGLQRQFYHRVTIGFAGRSQRDFVVDVNDFGSELTLELNQTFKTGTRLTVQTRAFLGFTDRRVISIENYNTLNVPVIGSLRLNIRQSNFGYRVNQIRGIPISGIAFRTNLTIGFGYGLGWKWL